MARWARRLGAILLVFAVVSPGRAQEIPVPFDLQWALISKILQFDRSRPEPVDRELVIGVAYEEGFRLSYTAKDEAMRAAAAFPQLGQQAYRLVAIDLSREADLHEAISRAGVDLLYVAPLRTRDPAAVAAACRATRTPTFTGVPQYVEAGLGVGIGARGGRPEIVVNLQATRSEGLALSAKLLRLCRIVRE